MRLVENSPDEILIKDVKPELHIVVAVIEGRPCILSKGFDELDNKYSFKALSDSGTNGNGYSRKEADFHETIRYYNSDNTLNRLNVFHEDDWKQALKWLIDNA